MATQFKLYQRLNTAGYPIVKVPYSRNGNPVRDNRATTYYVRYMVGAKRRCDSVGRDLLEAENQRKRMDARSFSGMIPAVGNRSKNLSSKPAAKRRIADEAAIYIERFRQKARKTYLGYKLAVNLFVASCKKTHLEELARDDMLDFKEELLASGKSLSTVFNTFLKVLVFLNDRGIGKYVEDDWLKAKDWPVNVDKKNKNKKYVVYSEEEVAAMLAVATKEEGALVRFCAGSGFRIGEVAVTQWKDVDWAEKTVCIKSKPHLKFHPKDYEERIVALPDSVLDVLNETRAVRQTMT
jgi:integrase